jgi:hypothetical protein
MMWQNMQSYDVYKELELHSIENASRLCGQVNWCKGYLMQASNRREHRL